MIEVREVLRALRLVKRYGLAGRRAGRHSDVVSLRNRAMSVSGEGHSAAPTHSRVSGQPVSRLNTARIVHSPASSLNLAAIAASRSLDACWYRRAAWAVEWPKRDWSSRTVAPLRAAIVALKCRRSCHRTSGRSAACRAGHQYRYRSRGAMFAPFGPGNTSPSRPACACSRRCFRSGSTTCGGMLTSRLPANVLGCPTTASPPTLVTARRTWITPAVRSTSRRRSSNSSPNLSPAHAATRTAARKFSGMFATMTRSSFTVGGGTSVSRLAPVRSTLHGFVVRTSSRTAVLQIVRSTP